MKQVVLVLVLFGSMIGGIVWNALYINKEGSRIVSRLGELPEAPGEEAVRMAQDLEKDWHRSAKVVGLSVGVAVMDRVSEGLAQLVAAARCGDYYGYRAALALLFDMVGDLSRLERFELDNLI